jgi:hypothetical protein
MPPMSGAAHGIRLTDTYPKVHHAEDGERRLQRTHHAPLLAAGGGDERPLKAAEVHPLSTAPGGASPRAPGRRWANLPPVPASPRRGTDRCP